MPKRGPLEPRFWKHVHKSESCWEWTAYCDRDGYGQFALNGKQPIMAHRMSWILAHGELQPGLMVCHTCDNPKCVRPEHLFLGDNSLNQIDSSLKLRHHHSRKTLCPKGHPLSGENLWLRKQKQGGIHRACRACHRRQVMARWRAKRATASLSQTSLLVLECNAPS